MALLQYILQYTTTPYMNPPRGSAEGRELYFFDPYEIEVIFVGKKFPPIPSYNGLWGVKWPVGFPTYGGGVLRCIGTCILEKIL